VTYFNFMVCVAQTTVRMPQLQPLEKVYKFKKVQKLKESRKVHKLQVVQQITQVTVVNSIYIVIEYVNVNSFFYRHFSKTS
jgi:hypothetical protein